MQAVEIYTTRFCPYCVRAKQLLDAKGVDFNEILVDNDPTQRQLMLKKSGRRTVPQIWIGSTHVGGFDDLHALHRSGQLDSLLSA